MTNDIGSALIKALEAVWRAIATNHPELPPPVIITGQGFRGQRKILGHHAAKAWKAGKAEAAEVFVAGETLQLGAEATFVTVLHEAVHGLAQARGTKDTSGQSNRYHNAKFLGLAGEMGMFFEGEPHPALGYSEVTPTPETMTRYAPTIAALKAALLAHRPPVAEKKRPADRNNAKLTCGCGRVIRASAKVVEMGPITCGVCGEPFRGEDDADGDDD